ncbi:MAG TPA: response regulator transcription factor [Limnochordales bacterium]
MPESSSKSSPIRVLIVDDHAMVRAGLRRILELEPDLQVVGEASDGVEAVEMSQATQPQVVLMDITMPRLNGVEATRVLRTKVPSARVVALTIHTDDQYVVAMARAGAWGYVLKDEAPADLIDAVRRVAAGQVYIPPSLVGSLVKAIREQVPTDAAREVAAAAVAPPEHPTVPAAGEPAPTAPSQAGAWPHLTSREREVLALIAYGRTNRQIAQTLVVSEKTVKNHVTSILRKLRLNDRTQAAVWAIRSGLVP